MDYARGTREKVLKGVIWGNKRECSVSRFCAVGVDFGHFGVGFVHDFGVNLNKMLQISTKMGKKLAHFKKKQYLCALIRFQPSGDVYRWLG